MGRGWASGWAECKERVCVSSFVAVLKMLAVYCQSSLVVRGIFKRKVLEKILNIQWFAFHSFNHKMAALCHFSNSKV